VSDKFLNPVQVPEVLGVPASEVGFARIYARDGEAYALFPNGEEKLLTGSNPVTPGTDRDISFADAPEISDTFSTQFSFADTSAASDAASYVLVLDETSDVSDSVNGATLEARSDDSLATIDAANSSIAFNVADTAALSDVQSTLVAAALVESAATSDSRQSAVADAVNWADVVVSSSNFTATENMVDTSETTFSELQALQTAVSGGSVTTSGNITVSLPDPTITPTPTVNATQLRWGWTTAIAGLLQSGNSVSINIDYSLDDGATFTTLETVTATNTSGDNVLNITATYAELLQVRFRASGAVTSGTATALNARQWFRFRYVQCAFNITQTL
jgi:hypothetical protein